MHLLIIEFDETVLLSISKAKEQYKNILLYEEPMSIKDLVINGYDVMALGLTGKEIGEALNKCLEFCS